MSPRPRQIADRYADDAPSELARRRRDFTSDMDSLGDLGVATAWVDIDGCGRPVHRADAGRLRSRPSRPRLRQSTLPARGSHVPLRERPRRAGQQGLRRHSGHRPRGQPDRRPARHARCSRCPRPAATSGSRRRWDTIMQAASESGRRRRVADRRSSRTQTGLSVPDDIETLLGDNLLFAVDSEWPHVRGDSTRRATRASSTLGVRFTGDTDELNDLYEKVASLIGRTSPAASFPFAKQDFDDGLVIATNDDYADKLAERRQPRRHRRVPVRGRRRREQGVRAVLQLRPDRGAGRPGDAGRRLGAEETSTT